MSMLMWSCAKCAATRMTGDGPYALKQLNAGLYPAKAKGGYDDPGDPDCAHEWKTGGYAAKIVRGGDGDSVPMQRGNEP